LGQLPSSAPPAAAKLSPRPLRATSSRSALTSSRTP
jgi:hypothetical protein